MATPALPITPLGNQVIVWENPGCVQCVATLRALKSMGAEYQVYDITEHPDAEQALRDAGELQMPAVQFRDDFWGGFRPDKLAQVRAAVDQPVAVAA